MGYSQYYLMFGHRSRLPVDFYFPTLRSAEVQAQSTAEAQRQKQHYDQKIGTIALKPGNLILVKADTFQGKRNIKDRCEEKSHKVVCQITTDIRLYKVKDQHGNSCVLHCNQLLLIASEASIPLHVGICQAWDRCTSPTPVKPTPRGSDSKTMPQENNGLTITHHQARKTSLGCINGKAMASPMDIRQSIHWRWGEVPRPCVVDMDIFIDRMADRIACIWWRNRHQPVDTIGWWTGQSPYLLTELEYGSKTTVVWNGYTPLHVKLFNDKSSFTFMWNIPTHL